VSVEYSFFVSFFLFFSFFLFLGPKQTENTEVPRCSTDENCIKVIEALSANQKPHAIVGADPKWRFFWKTGTIPPITRFPDLNSQPVIPEAFPQWEAVMNRWGTLMMDVCSTVAEMAAIGLGLEASAFTAIAKFGPHLLAPTASDLTKYGALGTVFAGLLSTLAVLFCFPLGSAFVLKFVG